jgi:pimeloyl-ACP methyl ester carboxylesterase
MTHRDPVPCPRPFRFRRLAALLFPLAAAFGNPPATPVRPPEFPPALHLRLGPDSNACGITVPAGAPRKGGPRRGLIVWLHGGMRSQNREKGFEAHRALIGFVDPKSWYLCSPSAFGGEEWLTPKGLAHIDALIDYMAAHYPIDTGDVNLVGVSDGSLGVIAYSLQGRRDPQRRVLISSFPPAVLPLEALAGQPRFARGSWDFLQGGRDRLFPVDQALPYLQQWERLYPNAHLHYFPDGEHDFSFYASQAPDLLKSLFSAKKGNRNGSRTPQKTPGIQKSPAEN